MLGWLKVVLAVVIVISLSACSAHLDLGGKSPDDPADAANFTTTFTRIAPQGYIDMSLDFSNPSAEPVTLEGRLVPRDATGDELSSVRVTTAFGTEAGRAVVMPGGSVDFVRLDGPKSDRVREITLEDVTPTKIDGPLLSREIDLTTIDSEGNDLQYDALAQQVRLRNTNAYPAHVRIVLMVLRPGQAGVPQEATLVRDVVTVDVPPSTSTLLDLAAPIQRLLRKWGSTRSFVTLRTVIAP